MDDLVSGLPPVSEWRFFTGDLFYETLSRTVHPDMLEHASVLTRALPYVATSIDYVRSVDPSLLIQAQMLAWRKAGTTIPHLES
jgi:hypothetical protein